MLTGRRCLHHAGSRLWRALVTLTVLAALALAGRGYLYCHMAERAMTSCCCASPATTGVVPVAETRCGDADAVTRPCCERRDGEAPSVATVELPEIPVALNQNVAAPLGPARFPPVGWFRRVMRPPSGHDTTWARAGPTRRGKRRARLGVTLR